MVGPNNRKLYEVNKMVNITLTFNNKNYNFQLLIVPNITMNIVIGSDYLNKYKVKIDYETRKLCIDDNWVEFKKENKITMNDNLSEKGIEVKNDKKDKGEVCYIEGIDNYDYNEVEEDDDIDINNIKLNVGYNYENEVKDMLEKYSGLVSNRMRVAKSYVHKLEVQNINNFKVKSYPIPYMHKEKVKEEIGKLLKDDIIEKSNTPYINPIVIVKKKLN